MGPSAVVSGDKDKEKLLSFPINRGIAGHVATTGEVVNLPDAYEDARFDRTVDKDTGYRTRSMLCVPVKNHRAEVVGVIQVINKQKRAGGLDMGQWEEEGGAAPPQPHRPVPSSEARTRSIVAAPSRRCTTPRVVPFSATNVRLLTAFSSQAAVAIENSRLFTETEKALNQALAEQRNLRFMLSVTKNLFSDLHLQSTLAQLVQQVHALMEERPLRLLPGRPPHPRVLAGQGGRPCRLPQRQRRRQAQGLARLLPLAPVRALPAHDGLRRPRHRHG